MALALVGSKTFGHNATSAQSCSLTDLTGGLAAAPAANDVVIVAYSHANATTAARSLAQCTPSGYSNLHPSVLLQNDSNAVSFAVSAKKMGGSPDTTVDIPAASATTSNVHCTIEVWRDVDFANITATAATTANGANTGLPNPPSISTPSAPAGCVVLGCFGAAVVNATTTAIANSGATPYNAAFLTGSRNTGSGSRAHSGMGARTGLNASTAFDAALSGGATANTGSWAAVSVMLRPNVTPVTASASPSIGNFTTTSAAKGLAEGIGSGTLNAFTVTAAGTVSDPHIAGSAALQISSFTVSSVAKGRAKAAAAPQLASFLSSSASRALIEGVGSGVLNSFSSTSAAKIRAKISGSPSLSAFTGSGEIEVVPLPVTSADAALAFNPFTAGATATLRAKASAAPVMSAFLSSSASRALIEGLGSGELNAFGLTSAVEIQAKASAAIELDAFTSDANAIVRATLSGSPEMWPFVSDAVIGGQQLAQLQGVAQLDMFHMEQSAIVTRIRGEVAFSWDGFTTHGFNSPVTPAIRTASGTLRSRRARGKLKPRAASGSMAI
jgi:hypothetical protein